MATKSEEPVGDQDFICHECGMAKDFETAFIRWSCKACAHPVYVCENCYGELSNGAKELIGIFAETPSA